MKTWRQALKDAVVVGGLAGFTSMVALALGGRVDTGRVWGPLNAPSHWIWGRPALAQDGPSLRYTATGLFIHFLSAGFWGVVHEKILGDDQGCKGVPTLIRDAAMTTALAAWVDLGVVPHRLTPGFQRRLSWPSLGVVYGLFGLGLAVGSYLTRPPASR